MQSKINNPHSLLSFCNAGSGCTLHTVVHSYTRVQHIIIYDSTENLQHEYLTKHVLMLKAQARAHNLFFLSRFNSANWLRDRNPFFLFANFTISIDGSVWVCVCSLKPFFIGLFCRLVFFRLIYLSIHHFFAHPKIAWNGLNTVRCGGNSDGIGIFSEPINSIKSTRRHRQILPIPAHAYSSEVRVLFAMKALFFTSPERREEDGVENKQPKKILHLQCEIISMPYEFWHWRKLEWIYFRFSLAFPLEY